MGVRDYIDQFSDYDMSIFALAKDAKKVPLPFEFHYLTGGGRVLEFNIHQQIIEKEYDNPWSEDKKEAYSRGVIHYDPSGEVKKLLAKKTKFDEKQALERLIYIVQQYQWKAQIHAIRACKRGFPQAGNDLIDESLDLLVEAIYLLEKKYRPHRKWRLVYIEQFEYAPKEIVEIILKAKLSRKHTDAVVIERVRLLNIVFDHIKQRISYLYPNFPDNPYEYFYSHNNQLNIRPHAVKVIESWKNYLTLEEYEKVKGLSCYNLSPGKKDVLELVKNEDLDVYKRLV